MLEGIDGIVVSQRHGAREQPVGLAEDPGPAEQNRLPETKRRAGKPPAGDGPVTDGGTGKLREQALVGDQSGSGGENSRLHECARHGRHGGVVWAGRRLL